MPPPIAVVDLGTNSTRLLVAAVEDGRVRVHERRTTITRLGEGVDSTGRLADAAIERVFEALAGYRELIDRHGADPVLAVATSAVRDSANGDDFRKQMHERFGIDARTITGDEEARLTFRGATAARSGHHDPTLVLDIGGGSTEFVTGRPGEEPGFHVSTQAGSVRQTERHLHDDPPTAGQLSELRGELRATFENALPREVRTGVEAGIAVAGTATQLAAVDLELERYDSERVEGHTLTRDTCERMLDAFAKTPLAERRQIAGLHPERAPTIVAGTAILLEALAAFGLGEIEVTEADLMYGAALQAP